MPRPLYASRARWLIVAFLTGRLAVGCDAGVDPGCQLGSVVEHSGIDAAFVYTFARYDLPHDEDNDDRDFDKASFGIVKVLTDGRTGTTYPGLPWEPKAAFSALAEYGRSRVGSAGPPPVAAG
ncbi:hypothetical protein [Streptomyces himastatinicus]|uniref:hypothetical protein n=1 Tax=Streptomyces himastatinicus TaxID=998084 RepID=UPI0001B511D3